MPINRKYAGALSTVIVTISSGGDRLVVVPCGAKNCTKLFF